MGGTAVFSSQRHIASGFIFFRRIKYGNG